MNITDYVEEVKRTSSADFPYNEVMTLVGLGIAGEAAEVAAVLEPLYLAGRVRVDEKNLTKELGDVVWYIVYCLNCLNLKLEDDLLEDISFEEYEREIADQMPLTIPLYLVALRLTINAGMVSDVVKKHLLHGYELNRELLVGYLYLVLHYLVVIAITFGIPMSTVLDVNRDKLRARYPNGWSAEASRNRQDETEEDVRS